MLLDMLQGAVAGAIMGVLVIVWAIIRGAGFRNKLIKSCPYRKGKEYFVLKDKKCDKEFALSICMNEYRNLSANDIAKKIDSYSKSLDEDVLKNRVSDCVSQIQIEALYKLAGNICPEKYKCKTYVDLEQNASSDIQHESQSVTQTTTLQNEIPLKAAENDSKSGNNFPELDRKTRYCKLCGGVLDRESHRCSRCGKQFFNSKKAIYIAAVSVASISIIVNVMLAVLYSKKVIENNDLQNSLTETKRNHSALTKELSEKAEKANYYDALIEELQEGDFFYSKDFSAVSPIVVINSNDYNQTMAIRAEWSDARYVYNDVHGYFPSAELSFDSAVGEYLTYDIIPTKHKGPTRITFSNSGDEDSFDVIVIVK